MSESEIQKEYEFTKGRVVYCMSVDTKDDPNLVKTMNNTTLNLTMIRALMAKGVVFKSLGKQGEEIIMKPAGLNSVSGLEHLPEFDI